MAKNTFSIICHSSFTFLENLSIVFCFNISHTCSMMLKSGDWDGQSAKIAISFSSKYASVDFDAWHEAPSCWKISHSTIYATRFSCNMRVYFALLIIASILAIFLKPDCFMKPQTMIEPPPNFKDSSVFWVNSKVHTRGSSHKLFLLWLKVKFSFITEDYLCPIFGSVCRDSFGEV